MTTRYVVMDSPLGCAVRRSPLALEGLGRAHVRVAGCSFVLAGNTLSQNTVNGHSANPLLGRRRHPVGQ